MHDLHPTLLVFFNDRLMGELRRLAGGKLSFSYAPPYREVSASVPLSLLMPLLEETHADNKIRPFLWGLLPDNEQILQRWARRFQVSATDCFGFLQAIGEDCAGAIRFVTPENAGQANTGGKRLLKPEEIEARLTDLRRDPALGRLQQDRGQFSLAGAQAKTALQRRGSKWYLPWGNEPTTHILKPPRPDLAGHAENEQFCLRLAAVLGLRVARSEIVRFGDEIAIVVERYDRIARQGKLLRIHQEDTCQALGVHPAGKYQVDCGPGVEAIMALLNRSSRPIEDRQRFMQAVAFNYLILGTDAHAKNYSLLLGAQGQVRLAPLYDLASLLPYAGRRPDERFAMKIDRYCRDDQIQPRHLERMARRCEFPAADFLQKILQMATDLPEKAGQVVNEMNAQELGHEILANLIEKLDTRCRRISRFLA